MFHMQRHRRLPEEHARFYSAEISCALNYLHERGTCVHTVMESTGQCLCHEQYSIPSLCRCCVQGSEVG